MAYKTFANGFVLNASELNTYLMNQAVMVFPTSSARATDIAVPVEGMLTYIENIASFQYWSGADWLDLIVTPVQTVSNKSSNYTILATDESALIRSTGSAITITIANVLSVGQRVDFAQYGSGQITFAAGAGVTLNSADGNLKTAKQYAGATVECVASGVYWLVGNLGA